VINGDFARIMRFALEVDRLKDVLRVTRPAAIARRENSAEHSWHVALLAALLQKHAAGPVDLQRVIEILLVHDIPEIEIGDTIVFAPRTAEMAAAEEQAARQLFGLLPEREAIWCFERWREYELRETPEARYAYAVDRLMPLLHNLVSGGAGWTENRVPLEPVLTVNAPIADALPEVWVQVKAALLEHAERGGFDHE
jgi:putative hydrolase of HD superfamily